MSTSKTRYQVSWHNLDKKWYVYEQPKSCRACGATSALMSRVRIGRANIGFNTDDEAIQWLHDLGVEDARIDT